MQKGTKKDRGWLFAAQLKPKQNSSQPSGEKENPKPRPMVSEQLRGLFSKNNVPVVFKP